MSLIEFAHAQGIEAVRAKSRHEQKALGQFMTPPSVARFMALRCLPLEDKEEIRILDPAAGTGILAAAIVEALLDRAKPPVFIQVILYEIDERLMHGLLRLADRMRRRAKRQQITCSVQVLRGDFLLSPMATGNQFAVDVVIANPPYFKLNASDPRARAHAYVLHGQPNIYGLFMAASASMLAPNGRWCFITPRSWTNGAYFSVLRRHLFRWLRVDAVHIFESRSDHFAEDEVLQEAMITWATAQPRTDEDVVVSSSQGSADLDEVQLRRVPIDRIVGRDGSQTVALPTALGIGLSESWDSTLETFGLKVSTGPVVAFRAAQFTRASSQRGTVPLLWMQHVDRMRVRWPIQKKREHILANGATAWMMVPNCNFVVLRRFSPKEDRRRVVAAPYLAGELPGPVLGLENHMNYIYRPGGEISDEESRGIAAYLNCWIVDQYLRTVAGNTQVNATDLRRLPLPPKPKLIEMGRRTRVGASIAEIDACVAAALGIDTPPSQAQG